MKKILKILLKLSCSLLIIIILLFIGLIIYTDISNRPSTDSYITGRTNGDLLLLQDSRFTYCTYDKEGYQIRKEELNLYSWGKFKIEFSDEEEYFIIYRSSYSRKEGDNIVSTYVDMNPSPNDLLSVEKYNKDFFKYFIKTDMLQVR